MRRTIEHINRNIGALYKVLSLIVMEITMENLVSMAVEILELDDQYDQDQIGEEYDILLDVVNEYWWENAQDVDLDNLYEEVLRRAEEVYSERQKANQ